MMPVSITSNGLQRLMPIVLAAGIVVAMVTGSAVAMPCAFEPQGEGRVAAVADARSFRLEDGREVRLAGIEPAFPDQPAAEHRQALANMLTGRAVQLRGDDDTPDRYGRQP